MGNNIKNYLEQTENYLSAVKPFKLYIDIESNYEMDDNIIIDRKEQNIWVNALISKVEFDDKIFNLVLDYPVRIYFFEENLIQAEESIEINFNEGDQVLETDLQKEDIKEQVKYTKRLLGGKELFRDSDHLFRKIYKVYGPISDMDLVHLEVLQSQVLRSRKNTKLPARMSEPWDPVTMDIKKIVFSGNFISSLQFENINEALASGLIEKEQLPQSILEKVLTGDF